MSHPEDETQVPIQRGQPTRRPDEHVTFLMSVVLYTKDRFVHGVVETLSEQEIFVATPDLLPVDTEVEFHLDLPGGERTLRGAVLWVRRGRSHQQPSGMGIGFLDLDPIVTEQIRAVVHGASPRRSAGAKIRIS